MNTESEALLEEAEGLTEAHADLVFGWKQQKATDWMDPCSLSKRRFILTVATQSRPCIAPWYSGVIETTFSPTA